jgi:hypothetical protein
VDGSESVSGGRAPDRTALPSRACYDLLWSASGKPMWVVPTEVTPAGETPRDVRLTVDGSVRTVTPLTCDWSPAWSYGGRDVLGR